MTEFGVFFIAPLRNQRSEQEVFDDVIEESQLAEELGYDAIWIAEHHFDADFSLTPSPNIFLAAAAVLTSRIKIGAAINVLPFTPSDPDGRGGRHAGPPLARSLSVGY